MLQPRPQYRPDNRARTVQKAWMSMLLGVLRIYMHVHICACAHLHQLPLLPAVVCEFTNNNRGPTGLNPPQPTIHTCRRLDFVNLQRCANRACCMSSVFMTSPDSSSQTNDSTSVPNPPAPTHTVRRRAYRARCAPLRSWPYATLAHTRQHALFHPNPHSAQMCLPRPLPSSAFMACCDSSSHMVTRALPPQPAQCADVLTAPAALLCIHGFLRLELPRGSFLPADGARRRCRERQRLALCRADLVQRAVVVARRKQHVHVARAHAHLHTCAWCVDQV